MELEGTTLFTVLESGMIREEFPHEKIEKSRLNPKVMARQKSFADSGKFHNPPQNPARSEKFHVFTRVCLIFWKTLCALFLCEMKLKASKDLPCFLTSSLSR